MNKSPSAAFRRSAAALEKAVEVLAEAIAIIQVAPAPEAVTEAERVYVPHMEAFGTVRVNHPDGKLVELMLDNGIYMQTLRACTQSVESALYNEESVKFPLTNREALQTAEEVRTLQLSLF